MDGNYHSGEEMSLNNPNKSTDSNDVSMLTTYQQELFSAADKWAQAREFDPAGYDQAIITKAEAAFLALVRKAIDGDDLARQCLEALAYKGKTDE
jgi:hypothetical protein